MAITRTTTLPTAATTSVHTRDDYPHGRRGSPLRGLRLAEPKIDSRVKTNNKETRHICTDEREPMMYRTRITGLLRAFLFAVAIIIIIILPMTSTFPQPASEASSAPAEEIVPFLNQTVVWYRQLTAQQQLVIEGSEILFFNDNRRVADQVVRLSFDFARERAQALSIPGSSLSPNLAVSVSRQYQNLA